LISGYAQSKWVAEQLISKANHLGLPVTIYRLGWTCASTETGACNRSDLHTFLSVAMMKLNNYPETMVHTRLHALPVDFTAKSIVYVSVNQSVTKGNIYHVFNPQTVVLFEDIIVGIYRCRIPLKSVSLEE
jgi:thioester reductase-like protein